MFFQTCIKLLHIILNLSKMDPTDFSISPDVMLLFLTGANWLVQSKILRSSLSWIKNWGKWDEYSLARETAIKWYREIPAILGGGEFLKFIKPPLLCSSLYFAYKIGSGVIPCKKIR